MPVQREYNHILMPIVTGLTTLLWGKTVLELTSLGTIHSPDAMADTYLFVMATYAGAGEIEKWQARQWDPKDDPWTERANRGGVFLLLWSLPFLAAYFWRMINPQIPFPAELKTIWAGLFGIFLAKNTSRSIRHSRRPMGLTASGFSVEEELPGAASDVLAFVQSQSGPVTTAAVCQHFPKLTRRHLRRLLVTLAEDGLVTRTDDPQANLTTWTATNGCR